MWPDPGCPAATPGPRQHLVPADRPGGLSLLLTPPCPGLGPRGACLFGSCLVPACPFLFCPNRFHSNWRSQIQNPFAWGNRGEAERGRVCRLLWGVCRLHLCCSLAPCWCGGHCHLPHSSGKAARSPGWQLHSSSSVGFCVAGRAMPAQQHPVSSLCPHPRVEEGRRRKGGGEERKSTAPRRSSLEYKPALWALGWSLRL